MARVKMSIFAKSKRSSGVRLAGLTGVTMVAFAGNSVLNRMAVGQGLIDPMLFVALRCGAGALALVGLMALQGRPWAGWVGRGSGVAGLTAYLAGFSLAYVALDAGTGALILFGTVQITMFAGALIGGEAVPPRRWAGAGVAFGGLVVLLAPAGVAPSGLHAVLMAVAGVGWGVYSLAGRKQTDALAATAANFGLAAPGLVGLALLMPGHWSLAGVALAVLSGAVTSGLGYALWYRVLPELGAARAGLAQLTVPIIAAAAGVLFLGEAVSLRFGLAALLVCAGVLIGTRQSGFPRR